MQLNKVYVRNQSSIFDNYTKSGLKTLVNSCWEDTYAVKYYYSFFYDLKLICGFSYPNKVSSFKFDRTKPELLYQFYQYLFDLPAPKVKRVALDIEVKVPSREHEFPDATQALYPVIACSFYSNNFKKVLLLRGEHLKLKSINDSEIEYCDTETELLIKTFECIYSYPFVLTYNGDNFDMLYLFYRSQKLNVTSPIKVKVTKYQTMCSLNNSIHIDLIKVITNKLLRNTFKNIHLADNNTLNEISKTLLKSEKIEMPDLNNCSDKELKDYCLRDSELTYKISALDGDKIFNIMFLVARLANMTLFDINREQIASIITHHLNFIYRLFDYLIANESDISEKMMLPIKMSSTRETYAGALTIEPKKGYHFNIYVLDVRSLYPTMIDINNLGVDSLACRHNECKSNIVPEHSFHVCKKNKSLFSLSIGSLKNMRLAIYQPRIKNAKSADEKVWYETVSSIMKLFCNSSYGVTAHILLALASSITAYSRQCFINVQKIATKHSAEVLYGDTDSIFIKAEKEEDVQVIIVEVKSLLGVDLDSQKKYRFCILHMKKNYLGVVTKDNIDIVGLVGKKRDTPPFIKKVFQDIVESYKNIVTPFGMSAVKSEIKKKINSYIFLLKLRKVPLQDLVIKRKLKNDSGQGQDYEVAQMYNDMGIHKGAGDYVLKILVNSRECTAKPVELVKSLSEVNIENYIDLMFGSLDQIISPLGISRETLHCDVKLMTDYFNRPDLSIEFIEELESNEGDIEIEFEE